MNAEISNKIPVLKSLCEKHQVESLYLFGSAIQKDNFSKNSDLDFLITFKEGISVEDYTENYFALQYRLREIFNRDIDLVTSRSLSNPYFIQSIEESKELIYAA